MSIEIEEPAARENDNVQPIVKSEDEVVDWNVAEEGTGKSLKFEEIKDKNKFIEIINEYLNCVLGDEDDIRLPRLMRVPSLIHKTSVLALLDSGSQASILSLLSIFRV
jgi:hypothetical protein